MTQNFSTIHDRLESGEAFQFRSGEVVTAIDPLGDGEWSVRLGGERIGRITRERRDRATYYVGWVEEEPETVNWVSDEIDVLVSRMITLR
ncbi:hypothetical protein [Microbacterium sp. LMI1x-1-1.1]|uniref:hypothetical protein n=1 Tax=Microbacterium sp. LMI1x-1-1.1 TaxID=3135246 RepID=UPI003437031A